jgi:hypothetical protein
LLSTQSLSVWGTSEELLATGKEAKRRLMLQSRLKWHMRFVVNTNYDYAVCTCMGGRQSHAHIARRFGICICDSTDQGLIVLSDRPMEGIGRHNNGSHSLASDWCKSALGIVYSVSKTFRLAASGAPYASELHAPGQQPIRLRFDAGQAVCPPPAGPNSSLSGGLGCPH